MFYWTSQGAEPVRNWLRGLDRRDRRIIGYDIKTLEYGWPVGMPVCRSVTSHAGLWEVRSSLASGRIARVLFCISDGKMYLLHGFIKKSRKTPKTDLDLAAKRRKSI